MIYDENEARHEQTKLRDCLGCGTPVEVVASWRDDQPVWCLECYNDQLGGEEATDYHVF